MIQKISALIALVLSLSLSSASAAPINIAFAGNGIVSFNSSGNDAIDTSGCKARKYINDGYTFTPGCGGTYGVYSQGIPLLESYIQYNFNKYYSISKVRIAPAFDASNAAPKQVTLTFADGSPQVVRRVVNDLGVLPNNGSINTPIEIPIVPPVNASAIRMTVDSIVGTPPYLSYAEWEVYGDAPLPADMISPANGSNITGGSATFNWNKAGGTDFSLLVGNTPGAGDIGNYSLTGTSQIVPNIPTDGRTIYVRLFSKINGNWLVSDYTYTTISPAATIISPVNGSTLSASSVTFSWNNCGASEYVIYAGTALGLSDIASFFTFTGTSATINGLPTDGSTVYVRLWSRINGVWYYIDYTYTAYSYTAAFYSPVNGSTLTCSSQTFTWNNVGADVYAVWVGSAPGTSDIHHSGNVYGTSYTATGLPTDGRTIYVRLRAWFGNAAYDRDYVYTSYTAAAAALTSPSNNSPLSGSSATFTWNSVCADVYVVWVGSAPGTADIHHSGNVYGTSYTATGLPTDGRTVYVRLRAWFGNAAYDRDYIYTSYTAVGAALTSPVGSTLTGGTAAFSWNNVGADSYVVWIGSTPGTADLGHSGAVYGTSYAATGLPTDGRTIYVRLRSWFGNFAYDRDYTYVAGP